MKSYLACFDISDDKIRYRVGKELGAHGNRVQKSVFELSFKSQGHLQRTRTKIEALLEDGDDCRFYRICSDCRQLSTDASGNAVAIYPAVYLI